MELPQEISVENVKQVFSDAADFVCRNLSIGAVKACAFFIDGLTSGNAISEYVLQPMSEALNGSAEEMLGQCLDGTVYSAVAKPVEDMEQLCLLLVNGFCVVVFEGLAKAAAFETRTGDKRNPAPPEVENTVKGPKDAFT